MIILFFKQRQYNYEAGTHAGFRFHVYGAVEFGYHLFYIGQTESEAFHIMAVARDTR